jgi:hypothetical protein
MPNAKSYWKDPDKYRRRSITALSTTRLSHSEHET